MQSAVRTVTCIPLNRIPSPRTPSAPRRNTLAFRILLSFAGLALLSAVPIAAQDTSRSLTLDEAVEIARENNPDFQVARNEVALADWEVRSAYGALLPSASASSGLSWQGAGEQRFGSLTAEQLGFRNQPSYYFSSYNLGVSYTFDGSTLLGPRAARAARDATEARIQSGGAALVLEVTRAYLEVLRQDDALRVVGQELERAEYNFRLAEGRLEVGEVTPLDVKQAEVSVGRATVTVLRTENAARAARIRLLVLLGLDPDPGIRLTSDFEITEPEWTEEQLVALALERNPALVALRASERSSDVSVRSARSSFLPSLSISAGISGFTRQASSTDFLIAQAENQSEAQIQRCEFENDLYSRLRDPFPPLNCGLLQLSDEQRQSIIRQNDMFPFDFTRQPAQASLTLSLPIFQGFSRRRQLEAARVEQENVRYRIREQELQLRADISEGLAAALTAWRTVNIEVQNSEVADEQLRLAREQYEVGSASFLQLVEAETLKAQADRDRIGSLYAFHDTLASLEAVVGTSLRSNREEQR